MGTTLGQQPPRLAEEAAQVAGEQQWKERPGRPFGKRVEFDAASRRPVEWYAQSAEGAAAAQQPISWKPSQDAAFTNRKQLRPSSRTSSERTGSAASAYSTQYAGLLPPGPEPPPGLPPPGFAALVPARRMLHSAPPGLPAPARSGGSGGSGDGSSGRNIDSAEVGGGGSPQGGRVGGPQQRAASASVANLALRLPLLQPWTLAAAQSRAIANCT